MKSPIAILILLGLAFVVSSKTGVDAYLEKQHQSEKNVAAKPAAASPAPQKTESGVK